MVIVIKDKKEIKRIKIQLPLDGASILRNSSNSLSRFKVLPM